MLVATAGIEDVEVGAAAVDVGAAVIDEVDGPTTVTRTVIV